MMSTKRRSSSYLQDLPHAEHRRATGNRPSAASDPTFIDTSQVATRDGTFLAALAHADALRRFLGSMNGCQARGRLNADGVRRFSALALEAFLNPHPGTTGSQLQAPGTVLPGDQCRAWAAGRKRKASAGDSGALQLGRP